LKESVLLFFTRRPHFALQHGLENLPPAFILARDGLIGFEAFLQTQARGRLLQAQDAPAIGEFQQKQFDAAFRGWQFRFT
jgi:hypothetical protein